MVDIGKRIKSARQKAGMSQEELAQAIGSTKSAVSRYEAGKRQPRYDQLLNIADALGVSVHALVDWGDVDKEAFKKLFIYGEGPTQPEVIAHEEPIDKTEVEVHELSAQELEALMAKLQDGKPLVLSPDDLAKLKNTPKEQVAAALDGQEAQRKIKQVKAPVFKMNATAIKPYQSIKMPQCYSQTEIPSEQRERLKEIVKRATGQTSQWVRYEHSLGVSHVADILEQLNAPQARIAAALGKLNEEGQEKAAERVEELTEIPRYQAQEPPTAPAQDTPAPQEGKDTTPPSEASQEPPEGRIQSITMICPICGQHLRGNTETGKAYCSYCNRSFPLPKKSRFKP